jgi:hypothetical protein
MIKKTYDRFILFSRKKQILLIVWGLHFLFLIALIVNHFWIWSDPPTRSIAVRTVLPVVETKISTPTVKTISAPPPQKPPTKITAAKPASKPIKPPAKKKENQQILQNVAAALTELETLKKKKEQISPLIVPDKICIESKGQEPCLQQTYGQSLIAYLESNLDLPEYGKVKLELCIDRKGHLVKSQVLDSENNKNSEFLKNRLPELTFPCFNDFQITENTLTFTISFRNAETF